MCKSCHSGKLERSTRRRQGKEKEGERQAQPVDVLLWTVETKRHIAVSPCLWLRLWLPSKEKQRIPNAIWQIYLQRQRSSSDATWVQMHVGKHRQTRLHTHTHTQTHLLSPSFALVNICGEERNETFFNIVCMECRRRHRLQGTYEKWSKICQVPENMQMGAREIEFILARF